MTLTLLVASSSLLSLPLSSPPSLPPLPPYLPSLYPLPSLPPSPPSPIALCSLVLLPTAVYTVTEEEFHLVTDSIPIISNRLQHQVN